MSEMASRRAVPTCGETNDKKAAVTDEEWTELRAVPAILSAAVSSADPSGLIGAFDETTSGERISTADHDCLDRLKRALNARGVSSHRAALSQGQRNIGALQ